jgi:hypothetical protein
VLINPTNVYSSLLSALHLKYLLVRDDDFAPLAADKGVIIFTSKLASELGLSVIN